MHDTAKDAEKIGAKLGEVSGSAFRLPSKKLVRDCDSIETQLQAAAYNQAIEDFIALNGVQCQVLKPGQYVIRYNEDGEFGQCTGWLYRDGGDPCVVTGKPVYVWRPLRDLIGKQPAAIVEDRGQMCAVDIDNGLRTYPWTYTNQPGNIGASVLGNCALRAKPGGDSIDHGLSLLRELNLQGLGIARVPALEVAEAKPHG